MANPYPNDGALRAGYQWTNKIPAGFALAADLSCGTAGASGDNVLAPQRDSPLAQQRRANSENHEKEGQNVLYADGHVTYQLTVFCGIDGDNIYANKIGKVNASPVDRTDNVLLPSDD